MLLNKNTDIKRVTEEKDSDNICGLHCIKIKDISVKAGEQTIIDNVNLHIHCGKVTAIIGKNGAGKTTLIRAILGEIKHSGSIEFMDLKDKTMKDLKVGYVPQYVNIEKGMPMSVYDLFAGYISNTPIFLRKSKRVYDRVKDQLRIFDAQDLIDKRACDLSGGELQRVLLAIAVTPVPNLLLLDEPVSGIDRNGMKLFYNNIQKLKESFDLAMIVVSHDFEFVKRYADYVILLNKTILKEGTFEEIRQCEDFKRDFGGDIDGTSI